jgi:hypothetical protein
VKLTVTRVEINGKRRVKVADESGKFYTGEFVGHHDFVKASNRLKIPEQDIQSSIAAFNQQPDSAGPMEVELSANKIATEINAYMIRNEHGTHYAQFATFDESFNSAKVGEVVEWQSKDMTCCLDIDIDKSVDIERILSLFSTIVPAPMKYWVSKSGNGLHAIYNYCGIYTAEELAAIAGFRFQAMEPCCNIELLTRTRMPPKPKKASDMAMEIFGSGVQETNFTLDNLLYSQADGNDLTQMVCDMYDYEVGKRYPHTMCPVVPSVRSVNNADPVVIFDDHVFCYICQADHQFYGSRAPGFFPFAALAGLTKETNIKHCIEHFVHWGHAKFSFTGNFKYDKVLYRALLKARHGDDPRIPAAIRAGEPIGMVRHQGFWADSNGTMLDVKPNSSRITDLPASMYVDGERGKIAINRSKAEWLASNSDLSPLGYKAITPIHGFQMTQLQDLPQNKIFAVLNNSTLEPSKRPQFLAGKDRMKESEYCKVFNTIFPGIHMELLTALLIGRGCSEHRAGLPPMFFMSGVTGSGKSTHVEAASAIFGDTVAKIKMSKDTDRFFNELINGKNRSGFIFFDEFFKHARAAKFSEVEAMESLLGFEENQEAYMIYVGSVKLGTLPMFVWADTQVPDDVLMHEQIGRRVYHTHLLNEVDWSESLAEAKILEPKNLRINGNDKIIHACNSLLSNVLETYFTIPATDFSVIESLGFKKMRNDEKKAEVASGIVNLFNFICKLPDRQSLTDFRKGFKELKELDLLAQLQTDNEKGSTRCRLLAGNDLAKMLKFKTPCKAEIESRSGKIYIRFVSYDGKVINEKLRSS